MSQRKEARGAHDEVQTTGMNVREAARRTHEIMKRPGTWPQEGALSYAHVTMMLEKMVTGEVAGEKAHRWLGWAQCAVVAAGVATLEDMKHINAEVEKGGSDNSASGNASV